MQYFLRAASSLLAVTLLANAASAQFVFSIDYHSGSVALPDSFGAVPITEGDLLTPALGAPAIGPLATPGIDVSGGATGLGLGLHATCVGHPTDTPCGVEVDAVSYGNDFGNAPNGWAAGQVWFSTDAAVFGFGASPAPTLVTEAICSDVAAALRSHSTPIMRLPA